MYINVVTVKDRPPLQYSLMFMLLWDGPYKLQNYVVEMDSVWSLVFVMVIKKSRLAYKSACCYQNFFVYLLLNFVSA
jgi:hypothetical protein